MPTPLPRRTRRRHLAAQLAALRAIVDDLDYGIVVLDAQRRVQFVNRTFRKFWRVPDDVAESRPTFIKLMYHGRGNAAYAVSRRTGSATISPSSSN